MRYEKPADKMNYRNRIDELNASLKLAIDAWGYVEDRTLPPTGTGVKRVGICKQCGGRDAIQLDTDDPWKLRKNPCCLKCFPDAAAQDQELRECIRLQKPRDSRAHELQQYRLKLTNAQNMLGDRSREMFFRTYRPQNDSQRVAAEQVERWATSEDARRRYPFVVLHGSPGLGKTHLLASAWKRIARTNLISKFINEGVFVSDWQRAHENFDRTNRGRSFSDEFTYGQHRSTKMPADLIEELQETPVLIIDDLGKARPTEAWMAALYAIIDVREVNRRPTLISTNHTQNELPSRVQPWTADRILSGLSFTLTGSSMRGIAA